MTCPDCPSQCLFLYWVAGCPVLLMEHVSGTHESCRHVVLGDDRAVEDGIPEPLPVHEGIERPFSAQSSGIAYFGERVQCRTGVVHLGTAVIVIDDGSALPGKSKSGTPGAPK